LRHIQRTRVLIHLLDGAGQAPLGDFVQINTELALFDPHLAEKPQIVVLNKMDLPQAQARWADVQAEIKRRGHTVLAISAVTHQGVRELMGATLTLLDQLPPAPLPEEVPVFRPGEDEDAFEIVREGEAYRVIGKRIQRAAAMTYWEYDEAVNRFHRILVALGIRDALAAAGAKKGDTVFIGDYELEWSE
jgi:GTP-binding protein